MTKTTVLFSVNADKAYALRELLAAIAALQVPKGEMLSVTCVVAGDLPAFRWAQLERSGANLVRVPALPPLDGPMHWSRCCALLREHARKAVSADADWCLLLDCDVLPDPDTLLRLRSHNAPLVSGLILQRGAGRPIAGMERHDPETGFRAGDDLTVTPGVHEVGWCSLGCFLAKASYVREISYSPYLAPDYDRVWAGEDTWFCEQAAKLANRQVLLDSSITPGHADELPSGAVQSVRAVFIEKLLHHQLRYEAQKVFLLHPESVNSAVESEHWPHWREAIDWLLAETPHRYLLTGQNFDGTRYGIHPRLVNLVGATALASECFALAERGDAYLGTPNSVANWVTQRGLPAVVCANTHLGNLYDRFWGRMLDRNRTQLLRQNADLATFQRAFRALEAEISGESLSRTKALLIQYASGEWNKLLDLTEGQHRAACERHGIAYQRESVPDGECPFWWKVKLLQQALATGWEWVAVLDSDCLWLDPARDLRESLRHGDFGACENDPSRYTGHQLPHHYNCGYVVFRNTPTAKRFLRKWLETPDNDHPWREQAVMNRLLAQTSYRGFEAIRSEWNSGSGNPGAAPVVRAWHGGGTPAERLALMQAEMP